MEEIFGVLKGDFVDLVNFQSNDVREKKKGMIFLFEEMCDSVIVVFQG